MPKLWLPLSYGGRTRNILIPYSQNIDDTQLDEIIHWQTEKTMNELKKLPPKQPMSVMKKKEVVEALRDFTDFVNRKKSGETKKYY